MNFLKLYPEEDLLISEPIDMSDKPNIVYQIYENWCKEKYYRKLESHKEFDEDLNFDKSNFKPSNKRHRRNVYLSNNGK